MDCQRPKYICFFSCSGATDPPQDCFISVRRDGSPARRSHCKRVLTGPQPHRRSPSICRFRRCCGLRKPLTQAIKTTFWRDCSPAGSQKSFNFGGDAAPLDEAMFLHFRRICSPVSHQHRPGSICSGGDAATPDGRWNTFSFRRGRGLTRICDLRCVAGAHPQQQNCTVQYC